MSPTEFPLAAPLPPGWSNEEAVRVDPLPPEEEATTLTLEAGFSNERASRAEVEAPPPDEPMEIGWSNARAVRTEEEQA